ncbi:MAG: FtsH protease activity modulator HflK [Rhodospirillales bacterium]|nr:FtsH protease activity modulator HflK [Alphaproteobacteria bacterium]MCB9986953.1 FtsH protease activity modulator HflK [Rhodospirillales bacterium]USO08272.1 MAG: FtsH protease activity modulator HflK [Rhodospirillales bacterium]
MTGNDEREPPQNPWAKPNQPDPTRHPQESPWDRARKNRGGGPAPDLDDLLQRARENLGNPFGNGMHALALMLLALLALWFASGIYVLQPSENGVIQRFGKYERTQEQPGLGYHLPWPVETLTKVNVSLDRRVQIGFVDSRASGQRQDIADESLMLTADANIVDIDVVVLWNISNAEEFVFNIRAPEETIKRVAESAIREIVGQTRLQPIITQGRDQVAARIQTLMQSVLDGYDSGVSVRQVLIQEATVPPDVLQAYNDVAAARQDAERFQNEATIYRNDIIPKARGQAIGILQDAEAYKQDVIARAKGDAQRFASILEAYRTGKDVTRDRLYIETMQRVLSQAQRIVVDQKDGSAGVVPILPLDTLRAKTAAPEKPAQ